MRITFKKVIKDILTSLFKKKAFSTSASACYNSLYQPKEPKCLQNNQYSEK